VADSGNSAGQRGDEFRYVWRVYKSRVFNVTKKKPAEAGQEGGAAGD
jgi:hypothetical protein